jgi:hypothetical protein
LLLILKHLNHAVVHRIRHRVRERGHLRDGLFAQRIWSETARARRGARQSRRERAFGVTRERERANERTTTTHRLRA